MVETRHSFMDVICELLSQRGGEEGRIGLAACLRKMSASSCFLNEPGLGREVGGSFYKHPCGTGGRRA